MSTKIKIACVGDSITFGYGSVDPTKDSYPSQLQLLLGDQYEVGNFGVTCAGTLFCGDFPYISTPEFVSSILFSPDIVIFMLGTNDGKAGNFTGHENLLRANMITLLNTYKNLPSKPIVFVATSPTVWRVPGEIYHDYCIMPDIVHEKVVPIQREVIDELGCLIVEVHSFTQGMHELFLDSIHPGNEGYQILAEFFYAHLQNYFSQNHES